MALSRLDLTLAKDPLSDLSKDPRTEAFKALSILVVSFNKHIATLVYAIDSMTPTKAANTRTKVVAAQASANETLLDVRHTFCYKVVEFSQSNGIYR